MIHPESVNDLELMPTTEMWCAPGLFEFIYEYEPVLEAAASKPLAFTDIRTVEVRDHCFDGGADV